MLKNLLLRLIQIKMDKLVKNNLEYLFKNAYNDL
jgi:hypothetical protein